VSPIRTSAPNGPPSCRSKAFGK